MSSCVKEQDSCASRDSFTAAPAEISSLVSNSYMNEEDRQINVVLFDVAQALKVVLHDNNLSKDMLGKAAENPNSEVFLNEMFSDNPMFKQLLNEELAKISAAKGKQQDGEEDYYALLMENFVYDSTLYEISVYIPNVSTSNWDMLPVVAVGTDLSTVDDDGTGDYIAGWALQESGQDTEIIINEHKGINADTPIIIAGVGFVNIVDITDVTESDSTANVFGGGKVEDVGDPYVFAYQILYRYDSSKRSEYRFKFSYLPMGATSPADVQGEWGAEIAEIHKDDVAAATIFTNKHCDILAVPLGVAGIYYVAYEYDWYYGAKCIDFLNYPGGILGDVCVKMKYENEWYISRYIPFNSQITQTYNQNKGITTIKWN